ncbi:hypothetical protein CC86DRAFT_378009 [Ophiobolus disseminans]|uniref:F-box domain-containing protein n=1 Tax=Ophiobolus disseminans TaxID=1469910 RepID=A0A6A7AEH9_9PLEO|nr:hypothetical protein CC86DRAFT_378009 [Ophiobolus disseminans]
MAPTTRAATKRLRGNAPSTTTQPYKKNARKRAAFGPNAPDPSKSPTNNRCYLLELPPELRNQIYEFALEDYADLTYAPCILHKPDLAEAQLWADRIWTSFGLTHSCKQIRVEYRPLWLRNLFIRSRYLQIAPFIETFLPSAKELQQGPKRIQSEWNRGLGDYCGARRDLTSLVRLRAYGSLDQFKCVPHKLVVGMKPER